MDVEASETTNGTRNIVGRALVAEGHPIGRAELERYTRNIARDVQSVGGWRRFERMLDTMEAMDLAPDLVVLGRSFASRPQAEAAVKRRFPNARIVRVTEED